MPGHMPEPVNPLIPGPGLSTYWPGPFRCTSMTQRGPIEAWIIDDTGFSKKGTHSVGGRHQYCGQLGKQVNCQVAVTLSIANHHASLPIAYRL